MNAGNFRFKLTLSSLWHLLLGATRFVWAQGINIPKLILLIDVSKWQGKVDFIKMFYAGAKGVIIKCGQGAAQDLRFIANWIMARMAGLPRGSYWFYDSRVDPRQQALNWWNWIKADPGELKHFLDLEESYGGPWAGWKNWKIFLQEFMRLSGMPASKIGIYTGYYYWIAHSPIKKADLDWFGQFDLWLAWYTNDPAIVKIPKPWTSLLMWQFGTPSEGNAYGAESLEIDQSYFCGDEQEYKQRFELGGAVSEPPIVVTPPARPEITPEEQWWHGTVLKSDLKVRTYPIVADDTWVHSYADMSAEYSGKIWAGNDYLWFKIELAADTAMIGKWVAVRSLDGKRVFVKLRAAAMADEKGIPLPEGTIKQVKHDQDAKDGKQRIGMPEVFPLYLSKPCAMTDAWQQYLFKLLIHSYTDFAHWDASRLSSAELKMLKEKFESLYKQTEAFTNFAGFPDRANYIKRTNLNAEAPQQEPLICCGNIVMVVGPDGRKAGQLYTPILTLDGNQPPPDISVINRLTAPHVIFCATNVAAEKRNGRRYPIVLGDGRYRVDPFPQLGSKDTLVALRTNGKEKAAKAFTRDGVHYAINYIKAARLSQVNGLVVPRVYVP